MAKQTEDDEVYSLTPWGIMYEVLSDYGFDPERLTGRMGVHLVDDFMDGMVRYGFVGKMEVEQDEPNG